MNLWLWMFVALTVIALVLVVYSTIVALRRLLRVRARLEQLQGSRLAVSLRGLESQSARFLRLSQKAAPLAHRAQDAVESIQTSAAQSNLPEARAALQQAGADISDLIEDLR